MLFYCSVKIETGGSMDIKQPVVSLLAFLAPVQKALVMLEKVEACLASTIAISTHDAANCSSDEVITARFWVTFGQFVIGWEFNITPLDNGNIGAGLRVTLNFNQGSENAAFLEYDYFADMSDDDGWCCHYAHFDDPLPDAFLNEVRVTASQTEVSSEDVLTAIRAFVKMVQHSVQ
jgi:hypothetical protein